EVADLLGAEDHQHDRQKDEPVPHAVKTHFNLSGRFQPNRAGANRADNYCEVYSSSRSRKSTTGAGTLVTPPSKMRRGVMPAPYTSTFASESIRNAEPSSATPAKRPRLRESE